MFALDFTPLLISAMVALLSFVIALISLLESWSLKRIMAVCIGLSFVAHCAVFRLPKNPIDIVANLLLVFVWSAVPCLIGVGIPALIGRLFSSTPSNKS